MTLTNKKHQTMKQNNGIIGLIIMILHVVAFVGSGVLAWKWTTPESFFGVIGFIIVWSILALIGYFLVIGMAYILGEMD